jgi:Na+/melibiose symporter-like transporter
MKKLGCTLFFLASSIMCYAAGAAEGLMSIGAAAVYAQAQKEKEQAIITIVVIGVIVLIVILIFVASNEKKTNITISQNESPNESSNKSNTSDDMKECPFCAESIKKKAKICRFCGREVTPFEENNNGGGEINNEI